MDITERTVKIIVSLPGQYIELTRARGFGDNPRFYADQVDAILDDVKSALRGMIEAEHGDQLPSEAARAAMAAGAAEFADKIDQLRPWPRSTGLPHPFGVGNE